MDTRAEKWKVQLNSLGEKVAKAPWQIKQKLYSGPKTHDAEVEFLKEKFKMTNISNTRLITACYKLEESLRGILHRFQRTLEIFEKIDQMSGNRPLGREFTNLIRRFELIRDKIENDFPFFNNTVIEPMNRVHTMCARIHNAIEHRDYLMHNVDNLKHKLNSFTPDQMATPGIKFEQDRMRIEVKYQKAMEAFHPFNQQLRIELEIFFELLSSLFRNWFLNYYYISYSIYYNMYTFITSCNEIRHIVLTEPTFTANNKLSPSTAQLIEAIENISSNISSQFHAKHDSVATELSKLKAVNFKAYYEKLSLQVLDSLSNNPNPFLPDQLSSTQTYCKAITDFQPSNSDEESALTLKKNDVVKVYRKENDVWWYGQCLRTNKLGYFPVQCTSLERY